MARSPAIVSRADSLIISTIHGKTSAPSLPTYTARTQCSDLRCSVSEPTLGLYTTIHISDLTASSGSTDATGTKYGITLMRQEDEDFGGFGAWMEHSGFAVQEEHYVVEGISISGAYGIAGGDRTGTAPTGSATWRGLMVGGIATGSNSGEGLQGDAILTYSLGGGSLDARFSNIKNLDRFAAHSTPEVQFNNVPVSSHGTFQAGLTGNRIQGGFYGPGHAEAAGIFEQSNIIGAFGAKRQ